MYFPGLLDTTYAYIDESGNFGFDFDSVGTSSHFIVTAIIVKKEEVNDLRNNVEIIRRKYFGNGEIKSSSISKDHKKRFKILDELLKLKFYIFSLVVDKQKIYYGAGLDFKKTFIKYLNKILYEEIKLLYPHLMIIADAHGTDKFMVEFEKYVNKTPNYSMFDDYGFNFVDSKNEPLIQLADFMSGTISFGFEKNKKCQEFKGYYNLIKDRMIALKTWPLTYDNYLVNLDKINKSEFDGKIATYCFRLAVKYIESYKSSINSSDIDKVLILKYLLNQLTIFNTNRYISSKELIKYINKVSKNQYNGQTFKTNIIACLRDNNVIISSSANGYKIPISKRELYSYTNITLGMVIPMLERLKKCRDRILALTDNELDILEADEYKNIKEYFDESQRITK